jgi:hypothetical protein
VAYGIFVAMINGSFTDTTIRDVTGNIFAVGIYVPYLENVTFDPTVIERVTAPGPSGMAFGIWMATMQNGSFTDTTIRDVTGNTSAYGIYASTLNNVTFDPTVIERVTAPGPSGVALGIFVVMFNGSFTDTTIRDVTGNTSASGIYVVMINGSFTGTTILDINGNTSAYGIYAPYLENVTFANGELTNCGHGIWLEEGSDNLLEGFIIRDNTLFDTGVHLETNTSTTTIIRNCFFNNVLQALDNGTNNNWDGNYWEPEPGAPGFLIPGTARSRDSNPLGYCPLCAAVEVPAVTPLGIAALVGLLAVMATSTIVMKKRKKEK